MAHLLYNTNLFLPDGLCTLSLQTAVPLFNYNYNFNSNFNLLFIYIIDY